MKQYIDKDALVEEIKKRIKKIDEIETYLSPKGILTNLLCCLDTFEVKEVDDELQGLEKEVAENGVNAIDRKRIPIVLKGEIKAKFKNEFNTLWQTVHGIQFANVAKHIIERLCLHFAAWGVYNLKGYCPINSEEKHKMDIEVKEIDLEKEILNHIGDEGFCKHGKWTWKECNEMIRYFFELGMAANNKVQKGE